jgi:hypothetical protein
MQRIELFELGSVDESKGTSRLLRDGIAFADAIDGAVIECQFECASGRYLIATSYGTGWDDALNIYLFDAKGVAFVDAIVGGGLMSSGVYRELSHSESMLDFCFFGDDQPYRLTVSEHKSVALLLPAPWRYRNVFSRHYLMLRNL